MERGELKKGVWNSRVHLFKMNMEVCALFLHPFLKPPFSFWRTTVSIQPYTPTHAFPIHTNYHYLLLVCLFDSRSLPLELVFALEVDEVILQRL